MGKRQSTFTGLSHFVLDAFKQAESQDSAEQNGPSAPSNIRRASDGSPPGKKRKVGLLGPGYEKYDATGLVPYYTDPTEVPERLKKCTSPAQPRFRSCALIYLETFTRKNATSPFTLKAVSSTRKAGTASLQSS